MAAAHQRGGSWALREQVTDSSNTLRLSGLAAPRSAANRAATQANGWASKERMVVPLITAPTGVLEQAKLPVATDSAPDCGRSSLDGFEPVGSRQSADYARQLHPVRDQAQLARGAAFVSEFARAGSNRLDSTSPSRISAVAGLLSRMCADHFFAVRDRRRTCFSSSPTGNLIGEAVPKSGRNLCPRRIVDCCAGCRTHH